MEILVVGIIILYILEKNKKINSGQFIQENTAFLDKLKEFRSTPDNVVEALNIVTEYITNKYWH